MRLLIWLAIIPSIIIAITIYKMDKKEKEPRRELFKAIFMGIISVIITLVISFILGINNTEVNRNNFLNVFLYSFFGIALIEELSKWLCSYIFLRRNKNYNYLFDGIVYVTFISLGFATVENIIYTIACGVPTGLIRAITTVPAHAFFGITCGYYMSLSKKAKISCSTIKAKLYLILSLLLPVLLHGFYDFCLLTENSIMFTIYLIFVVTLYTYSIYHVRKMMKIEESYNESKLLYCSNCGRLLNKSYCRNCGKKIKKNIVK